MTSRPPTWTFPRLMTVRDNMGFALKTAGAPRPEIARKVGEAAAVLKLDALLDRVPKELSGGQRQRVAIGRSIVREPSAFLFDEPLSNLDAALRVNMRLEISELHQNLATGTPRARARWRGRSRRAAADRPRAGRAAGPGSR